MFNLNFKDIKNTIKSLTKILILITTLVIFTSYFYRQNNTVNQFFAQSAVYSFIITMIPGIIRRFELSGFFKKIQTTLMFSRSHMGILMFLAATVHYLFISFYPTIQRGGLQEITLLGAFGAIALLASFPLFVTSNTLSKKILKKNWQKLHRISYLITWSIFIHVVLSSHIFIAAVLAIFGVLQVMSLVYKYLEKSTS